MNRKNIIIVTIFVLILLIFNLITNLCNISLAEDVESTESSNTITGGGMIPGLKPATYLSPYPVLDNYEINEKDCIVEIPENITVMDFLKNIKVKLMDDEKGREWKLTNLPQTFIDESGEEKNIVDVEVWEEREKATYGAYVEEVDDRITFWVTNMKGKALGINDIIGTGTKIEWGSIVIAGELEVQVMETVSVKGDVTGDGISNIYDITGLVSMIYDEPEDYEWDIAVKNAAIVTGKEKQEPDIYDIQQMVENNFDN